MFKQFFLPVDCKLCYWGRLALMAAAGSALGTATASYWAAAPFVVIAGLAAGAKWLVTNHS